MPTPGIDLPPSAEQRAERARELQARYERRKGEVIEIPNGDATGFDRWKILDVVRGDDTAPVILRLEDAGEIKTIPAARLDHIETATGAGAAGAAVVPVESISRGSGEGPKQLFKKRYGAVDISEDVERRARDVAEEELHREKKELTGVSGFLLRIVKHNIGYEITRQLAINRARAKILKEQDVYAHEDGTRAEHAVATTAVIDRFIEEHEEFLHKEGKDGERRKVFGETDAEKAVKKQMNDLVRQYATTPAMTDAELYASRARIFKDAKKLSGEAKSDGLMYADNLKEIAEQVRIAAQHAGGIDNLDIDLDFVLGKAKLGARTEHEKGVVDSVLDKMQSWGQRHSSVGAVVGAFRNEIAVAVAATVGLGAAFARTALSSTAANALTFGGSGLVTGLYGWWKEKGRLNRERALHERQMALGGNVDVSADFDETQNEAVERQRAALQAEYGATSVLRPIRRLELRRQIDALKPTEKPRRTEMDKFAMERIGARQMIDGVGAFLTPEGALNPGFDPAIVMKCLTEIDARVRISNTEKVDLIMYSSAVEAEKERRDLDEVRMKLRAALRAANTEFQTEYDEVYRGTSAELYGNKESGVRVTNEKFAKYAGRLARRRGAANAVIGTGIGFVAHEVYTWATDGEYVTESLGNAAVWLKRYLSGEAPVVPVGEPAIAHIADGVFSTPNGTHLVPQDDGSFTLEVIADQKKIVSGLHIGDDGMLDDASRRSLEKIGASIVESNTITDHTETITERVGVWDWLHEHAPSVTHIKRDLWLGNDTPAPEFDFNEQGLDWGETAGVNANGDFVMDMSSMTSSGSWQGATHIDALNEMAAGKMRLVLTMSEGSQNHAIEIVVNEQGQAIIPANSDIARTFFAVEHGKPVFLGKYAEIALSKGFDEKGTDHLMILATHVGKGLKEGVLTRDIGECVSEPLTQISLPTHGPFPPLVLPPILPIRSRQPLERLSPRRGDRVETSQSESAPAPAPETVGAEAEASAEGVARVEAGVPASAEAREGSDYGELLRSVNAASDKPAACREVLRTLTRSRSGIMLEDTKGLVETALNDLDQYGDAMKELVLYAYRNHHQERFFKHPTKDEMLFVDDDGELISFKGELSTIPPGLEGVGRAYIQRLGMYEVLTGPNKGKTFDGSAEAAGRGDVNSRPLRGPDAAVSAAATPETAAAGAPAPRTPLRALPKPTPRVKSSGSGT